MPMDRWMCGLAPRPRLLKRSGCRRFPARAGSRCCGSMDRWNPGSTKPGDLGKLSCSLKSSLLWAARWLTVPWSNKQAGKLKASSKVAVASFCKKIKGKSPRCQTPEAILEIAFKHGFESSLQQQSQNPQPSKPVFGQGFQRHTALTHYRNQNLLSNPTHGLARIKQV